jgi:hypothetical protein
MRAVVRTVVMTLLAAAGCASARPARQPDGWLPLFDGRTLAGWRASEHPATFRAEQGTIVVHGPRAHLFYDGPVLDGGFRDFELRAEVLTRPGANSGIFIRTAFQAEGWPSQGYEVQVNNSHSDWRRTGSLYAVQDVREAGRDGEWFTVHAIVRGRRVRVLLDGRQVVDYTEPEGTATRLTGRTIALQGHDPDSEVRYRNVMVRRLDR